MSDFVSFLAHITGRKACVVGVCIWGLLGAVSAQSSFELRGIYQGENVFIQNPLYDPMNALSSDRVQFCIEQITVNGTVVYNYPKQSAIEVDLGSLALSTSVRIVVTYAVGCLPVCLNPEALKPGARFRFVQVYSREDTLCFETVGEESQASYFIERLIGVDWERLNEVPSQQKKKSLYCLNLDYYQGPNQLRICYESPNRQVCSSSVEIWYTKPPITFSPEVVVDKMVLSEETDFEILDAERNVILQGHARVLQLRLLKSGEYFIVLDGEEYLFFKK